MKKWVGTFALKLLAAAVAGAGVVAGLSVICNSTSGPQEKG